MSAGLAFCLFRSWIAIVAVRFSSFRAASPIDMASRMMLSVWLCLLGCHRLGRRLLPLVGSLANVLNLQRTGLTFLEKSNIVCSITLRLS